MGSVSRPEKVWWKDGVAYQIYPASFADANGDGLGDIPGIISKIDYLASLGIDIVWVSPMFESPQVDMGYDISNYEGVHAPYGTVEDMEVLIAECHKRGMKLILDLVVNHTSDQHAWFNESRSSRENPKRDWYVWKKARIGPSGERIPPNNWRSYFSGSVWEWDEATQEYYLHLFAKEQPDLNWENPETRKAIYDSAMRFWLDKGVDGFRVDCVNMYSKPLGYEDVPVVDKGSFPQPGAAWANGPRIHEFLREMNSEVLDDYDSVTVGELPHTSDPADVLKYVSAGDRQLSMVFQFDIVDLGQGKEKKYWFEPWTLPRFKEIVARWQKFIDGTDGWTTAFCENHDQGRSVSRYASDDPKYRELSAKMLSIMLCSLTGTLFVYQGQEIGMVNVPKHWPIEDYQDIESVNFYRTMEKRCGGDKETMDYVMSSLQLMGRDNARLPMQWDDSAFAGFTERTEGAWMRVHDLYPEINVAKQEMEPGSVLSFWKSMIRLRKERREVFIHGSFEMVDPDNEQTFVFIKRFGGETAVVALNFSGEDQAIQLPVQEELKVWVGNYPDVEAAERSDSISLGLSTNTERTLRPWEGRLYLGAMGTGGNLAGM